MRGNLKDLPNVFKGRTVELPLFPDYIIPNGGLTNERTSHALFYYYVLAMNAWETEKTQIVYEGDADYVANYRNLFNAVSRMYDVDPEHMINAWASVDTTCDMHNMPKLPQTQKYRHRGGNH